MGTSMTPTAVVCDGVSVRLMDELAAKVGHEAPASWTDRTAETVLGIYQDALGLPVQGRESLVTYVEARRRWAAELDREKSRPAWAR
jgi:hypothetical protein